MYMSGSPMMIVMGSEENKNTVSKKKRNTGFSFSAETCDICIKYRLRAEATRVIYFNILFTNAGAG
jgi:hypothetical protein